MDRSDQNKKNGQGSWGRIIENTGSHAATGRQGSPLYLYAGAATVVRASQILGVFDLDTATSTEATRGFLAASDRAGRVRAVKNELPKAFIVLRGGGVVMTQISSSALAGRGGKRQR